MDIGTKRLEVVFSEGLEEMGFRPQAQGYISTGTFPTE